MFENNVVVVRGQAERNVRIVKNFQSSERLTNMRGSREAPNLRRDLFWGKI